MNSSVFNVFLDSERDVEERTASGKLFQTEVAAAEKPLPPMVARRVLQITRDGDEDEDEEPRCVWVHKCAD